LEDVSITILGLLGELLLQSPNTYPDTINILGEYGLFLYLREVGVKYWDNPIIIVKKEMYWELLKHTFFQQ